MLGRIKQKWIKKKRKEKARKKKKAGRERVREGEKCWLPNRKYMITY